MTETPDLASAIAMLAQSTTQNNQILQQLVEKVDKLGQSQQRVSDEQHKEDHPVQKIVKYYIQKLARIGVNDTWENDNSQIFEIKTEAEEYGMKTYGPNKYRLISKAFYISKPEPHGNVNTTSAAGEVSND